MTAPNFLNHCKYKKPEVSFRLFVALYSLENEFGNDVADSQLAKSRHNSGEHVAVVKHKLTDLSCSCSVKGYAADDGTARRNHEVTADSREHPD